MQSEQNDFEVVPPIIIADGADIQAYPSVKDVILYVELVDVLNNVCTFYDSRGRVLEARVHNGRVSLVPTPNMGGESDTLRKHIIGILRLSGMPDEGLPTKPFSELTELSQLRG
jgi:hypothetical protein